MNAVINPKSWDHSVFSQLFIQSPKKAFEYRFMSTGTPIPDEWLDKPAVTEVTEVSPEVTESVTEVTEEAGTAGTLSVDQLKELLTANEIKFSHLAGEKKLMELCKSNNLV